MSTIKAIETRYAGCRFRSRLEARWAVAFDHLGIEWEYEPEGFETKDVLDLGETGGAYLPDFWLPDHDVFAEVKGSLTNEECARLLNAAAYLSSPSGGCGGGHDVVILGPVPRSDRVTPIRLHWHKGDLIASRFALSARDSRCWGPVVASDGSTASTPIGKVAELLLNGTDAGGPWSAWTPAYDAARSARFEHGEQGTPVRRGQ